MSNLNVSELLRESVQKIIHAVVDGDPTRCADLIEEERSNVTKCCELLGTTELLPALWAGVAIEGASSGFRTYIDAMESCAMRAEDLLVSGMPHDEVRDRMREDSEALAEHLAMVKRYMALFQADAMASAMGLQVAIAVKQASKSQPKKGEGLN